MRYQITIKQMNGDSEYSGAEIYQQTVEGDDSIIVATMLTIWRYLETQKGLETIAKAPEPKQPTKEKK